MSGHSHWAGIKHKKAVVDNRRGRLFSKLARDIMVAARNGADPGMNLTLRYAIDKARAASMPRDNIERAVKKGSGEGDDAVQFTPCTYEGYGPGSVAILVDCLTDNRTRTAPGIKSIFEKRGGNMGAPGCVRHLFERKSLFLVPAGSVAEETLMEAALEAGAADVQSRADGDFEVTGPPLGFHQIRDGLERQGIKTTFAEVRPIALVTVPVDEPAGKRVLALIDALEDHEDVQTVAANFDMEPEVLARLTAEET